MLFATTKRDLFHGLCSRTGHCWGEVGLYDLYFDAQSVLKLVYVFVCDFVFVACVGKYIATFGVTERG